MTTTYLKAQTVKVLSARANHGRFSVSSDRMAVVGTISDDGTVTAFPDDDLPDRIDYRHVPLFAVTTALVPSSGGVTATPLIPVTRMGENAYSTRPEAWRDSGNWAIGSLDLGAAVIRALHTSPLHAGSEILMPIWDYDASLA